jgi:hypothetical protein
MISLAQRSKTKECQGFHTYSFLASSITITLTANQSIFTIFLTFALFVVTDTDSDRLRKFLHAK